MARTLPTPRAIAEGLSEWQEQAAEWQEVLDTCTCCCTGECRLTTDEIRFWEEKVFYGELDAWPF
jgi:hypothetical protein